MIGSHVQICLAVIRARLRKKHYKLSATAFDYYRVGYIQVLGDGRDGKRQASLQRELYMNPGMTKVTAYCATEGRCQRETFQRK